MTEDTQENTTSETHKQAPSRPQQPVFLIPKSLIYIVAAIVVGSFAITLFVRNPYTMSTVEGGDIYETNRDDSLMLWVAIFIGIPASFWAYKNWVLPMFERKR
jgi:hypothetical protein